MQLDQFGKYLLLRKLAVGGMAEIFLAKQGGMAGFEKLLVIKRILPELAGDQDYVNMFLDEARLAASMNHPNVAQVFDLDRVGKSFYIAMEYIAGQDLARLFRRCRKTTTQIDLPVLARILIGACEGLHYAHSLKDAQGNPLNLVHRDMTPSNILVAYEGSTKVLDFGVAKAETQVAKTAAGKLKGKFPYMAPEQIRMEKLDARTDVWALGVVLWEGLANRRLFAGENELGLLKAILEVSLPVPSQFAEGLPEELEVIAMRALQRDRAKRYPSAQAMQRDLESYLRTLPTTTTTLEVAAFLKTLFAPEYEAHAKLLADIPQASPEQLADLVQRAELGSLSGSGGTASGASEARTHPGLKKKRWPLFAAAGGALALLAAVGALLLRPGPGPAAAPAPEPGTLSVVTDPAGANIYVDGARQVPSPVVVPGLSANVEHTVIADKDGYEVASQKLTLAPGARREIAFPLKPKPAAPAAPTTVKLAVTSVPPGAKLVRADSGEALGVTPVATSVPASKDEVVLKLELEGYDPVERKVTLAADTTLEVALSKAAPKKPGKGPKKPKEVTADGILDPFAQ